VKTYNVPQIVTRSDGELARTVVAEAEAAGPRLYRIPD
jgi:hypothetical protein